MDANDLRAFDRRAKAASRLVAKQDKAAEIDRLRAALKWIEALPLTHTREDSFGLRMAQEKARIALI